MLHSKNLASLILALLLFSQSGCVRYIDSREELAEKYDAPDPATERAGIEGFYRYEQEQRVRLENLINQRKRTAGGSSFQAYQIDQGDEVELFVKDFPQVSKSYTVGPDGKIRLPVAGKVKISGLSEEAAEEVISSVVQDFVLEPQVDLSISRYSNNIVWILNSGGQQNRQGQGLGQTESQISVPIKKQNYSLTELLVELGDPSIFQRGVIYFYPAFNENSRDETDLISRFNSFNVKNWSGGKLTSPENCNGQSYEPESAGFRVQACYPYFNNLTKDEIAAKYEKGAKIEINLEELFGGATRAPVQLYLKPGDLVRIPQSPIIQVFGEVHRRGTFQVINAGGMAGGMGGGLGGIKPTLFSVLTEAQGLTYSADIHQIQIYREIHFGNKAILSLDLEKVVLWAGQDVRLRDGDIVYVPSKAGRYAQEQTINTINQLTGSITNVDRAVDINAN